MFTESANQKWVNHYQKLMRRAKDRLSKNSKEEAYKLLGYIEGHHIIPRCLGGSDDNSNIAFLTPEEHFVAHQLLVKIFPENEKLAYAANMMCVNSKNTKRSNKAFGWIRRRIAQSTSLRFKDKHLSGEHKRKLSIIGKGRSNTKILGISQSPESNKKRSIALKGRKKTEEHKRKIGLGNKDKVVSDSTKALISKSKIGKKIKTRSNESYKMASEKRRNASKYGGNYLVTTPTQTVIMRGIWEITSKLNITKSAVMSLIITNKIGTRGQGKGITITKI